jgi:tol-pal system protein YbgF
LRQMEQKLNEFMSQTADQITANNGPVRANQAITNDVDGDNNAMATIDATPSQPYQLGTLNANGTTPASLYDQAFSFLQTNDYASAQAAFENFIAEYPDHSLAANAQYWLGETFYARNDYEAAARTFAKSYQDYPQGQKAPDTLLKLGMSLGNRDMKDEACLTLGELKKRFPNGPPSIMKKADEQSQSYGCDA